MAGRGVAAAAATGLLAAAASVHAQEVRLGVGYPPHGPETGSSVVLDVVGPRIQPLKLIGAPRPYLGTQLSLEGYTNYAQAGLLWRWERKRTYLDLGAGLSVHDGHLDLPPPTPGLTDAENDRRRAMRKENIAWDRRWVFHATFAVGYRIDERWAIEFEGQHWSNGELSSDTHDGADSLGVRAAYRF